MPPRLKRSGTHDRSSTNNNAAGLAPPGRRIIKQKSNGALGSGSPNGRPKPTVSPSHPDAGIIDAAQSSTPSRSSSSEAVVHEIASDDNMGALQSTQHERDRATAASSEDDIEAHGFNGTSAEYGTNGSPLKIDINAAYNGRPGAFQKKSPLATAATILKACPLWDVIAILIILLQLPPTIISIVQFLFAFLTFVSPTSGTSIANMPSINEVLLGVSGAPSLQTVIFLDTTVIMLFIFFPTPAQNLLLDLAQAVIAISLGGAASSSGSTSASVLSCIAVIGLSHLVRWDTARQMGINLVWTGLVRSGLQSDMAPPTLNGYMDTLHASHGWPRKVVGMHILIQGVTRLVRRWYLNNDLTSRRPEADTASTSALNTPRTVVSFSEQPLDPASSQSTDGRPPGPSPAVRKEDALSHIKRKKKQAHYVRSQQPFWAALANAKVTFLKELEHQQASSDALEADATDITNVGNADFNSGRDRVWIKEVGSSEISFGVSLPRPSVDNQDHGGQGDDHGIRRFRVRLNKTEWSSTRIFEEAMAVERAEGLVDEWSGKIFGLTAATNYICEFVRVDDGSLIYTTHITTQPALHAKQAPVSAAQATQSLRPLSPTTTLRNSIQAAEHNLEGHRTRSKRSRREHKNVASSLQKEVDALNSRLSSNNGNDDRLRQKVRQLEQSIQQAKAKEAEIAEALESSVDVPAHELDEYNRRRAQWQSEKDKRNQAQKELNAAKASAEREVASLRNELGEVARKHQRLEQRKLKFDEQREQLLSEANKSQEAQSRRYQERQDAAQNRQATEQQFLRQIGSLDLEAQSLWAKGGQHESQARMMEELHNKNMLQQAMPTTPEGILPGTRQLTTSSQPDHSTFPSLQPGFQFPNTSAAFPDPTLMPTSHGDFRGRSSSMHSGISGFTDDLDEYQMAQQHIPYHSYGNGGTVARAGSRKSSAGSRGSTSTGSSTKDPMSPAPKSLSPIGRGSLGSPLSPPSTAMR